MQAAHEAISKSLQTQSQLNQSRNPHHQRPRLRSAHLPITRRHHLHDPSARRGQRRAHQIRRATGTSDPQGHVSLPRAGHLPAGPTTTETPVPESSSVGQRSDDHATGARQCGSIGQRGGSSGIACCHAIYGAGDTRRELRKCASVAPWQGKTAPGSVRGCAVGSLWGVRGHHAPHAAPAGCHACVLGSVPDWPAPSIIDQEAGQKDA